MAVNGPPANVTYGIGVLVVTLLLAERTGPALLMSVSSVIVATNAVLLKRTDAAPARVGEGA